MFKKKKDQYLSTETLQQASQIIEKVISLLGTISHSPSEWEEVTPILSTASSGRIGSATMAAGIAMAATGAGAIVGAAVKATQTNSKVSQMDSKAMGIIALLKEQCSNAERYKGMNYSMIDSKGQSLLNTIVNNTSSLLGLLR